MFGVDDVLIGAAVSGLGSMATNWFNKENVEKTNEANAAQAQMNREFQERMSNTAYQRGMVDMKAAGLNPILAYQKGGASSPSGSQAAMTAPEIKGNPAGEALNSGLSVLRQHLENANLYQQNKKLKPILIWLMLLLTARVRKLLSGKLISPRLYAKRCKPILIGVSMPPLSAPPLANSALMPRKLRVLLIPYLILLKRWVISSNLGNRMVRKLRALAPVGKTS